MSSETGYIIRDKKTGMFKGELLGEPQLFTSPLHAWVFLSPMEDEWLEKHNAEMVPFTFTWDE